MNKPLVTIGIPTYNRPIELKVALESALNQTYKNLEIILSDNCSTDPEVEKVCREYAESDNRIKYFRQKENLGIGGNGQFLIDNISGEYCFILNDDDWISENFVERAIETFLNHPDCSLVYGTTELYFEDMSKMGTFCFEEGMLEDDYIERACKFILNALEYRLATALVKTENAKAVHEYGKNRLCEDYIYLLKQLHFGKLYILKDICYHKVANGATKNLDCIRETFKMPELTLENLNTKLIEAILDAVLFDDFFVKNMTPEVKKAFIIKMCSNLVCKMDDNLVFQKDINYCNDKTIFKYLSRKPFDFFRKKFHIVFERR